MFCDNPECSHKTFSEVHPFVSRKGRKTSCLEENILNYSVHLSSVNASRLLKKSGINIGKSSICELLKKIPYIVDKSLIRRICVDYFAIKKRFSYGTVMVDLDTHRIINLLPSRDTGDVEKWLASYPNLEVISRDGAAIYAAASAHSHPEAVQVSDRFHLIKG